MHDLRTLSFSRKPIRLIIDDDGIWFAARDLFNVRRREPERSILGRFRPEHLKLLSFSGNDSSARLICVSPLGAATIAKYLGAPLDRMLDGWVRNRTGEIATEFGRDPLGMTLLADDTLPVQPRFASDLYFPFDELRHHYGYRPTPLSPNKQALALLDEDADLRPDPIAKERAGAFIASLMQAGTVQVARTAQQEAPHA